MAGIVRVLKLALGRQLQSFHQNTAYINSWWKNIWFSYMMPKKISHVIMIWFFYSTFCGVQFERFMTSLKFTKCQFYWQDFASNMIRFRSSYHVQYRPREVNCTRKCSRSFSGLFFALIHYCKYLQNHNHILKRFDIWNSSNL